MRVTNRVLALCAAVVVLIVAIAVPAQAGAASTLLARINNSRAGAGLPPVERYWDLTDDAQAHTEAMVAAGYIYHNSSLGSVTGVWQALGENVGVGFDANSLHDAFMASSEHRANILGDFNYVGIGSVTDADGLLWVTVVFMKAQPGLNGTADTTTTTTPTTTTTTTTTTPPTTTATVPPPPTAVPEPVETTTTTLAPQTTPRSTVPIDTATAPDTAPTSEPNTTMQSFGRPDGLPAVPF